MNMPVKWVFYWQPYAPTTVNSEILNQIPREVCQCAENIYGVQGGRWKSTFNIYRPDFKEQANPSDFPRDILGISFQEQPSKYYYVIRGQQLVVEADSKIQTTMEKFESYKLRTTHNLEGFQYQLGDFQLKVGAVVPVLSDSSWGIVLEVDYLPISSNQLSEQIMSEFNELMDEVSKQRLLPGQFERAETNFAEYGLGDQYTWRHTAVQYASIIM